MLVPASLSARELCSFGHWRYRVYVSVIGSETLSPYHSLVHSGHPLCGPHERCHVRRNEACSAAFQRTSRGQLSTQYKDQPWGRIIEPSGNYNCWRLQWTASENTRVEVWVMCQCCAVQSVREVVAGSQTYEETGAGLLWLKPSGPTSAERRPHEENPWNLGSTV